MCIIYLSSGAPLMWIEKRIFIAAMPKAQRAAGISCCPLRFQYIPAAVLSPHSHSIAHTKSHNTDFTALPGKKTAKKQSILNQDLQNGTKVQYALQRSYQINKSQDAFLKKAGSILSAGF